MALRRVSSGLIHIVLTLWSISHLAHSQFETSFSNTTIRIDCGGSKTFVNEYNETWLSDRFYTGGSVASISASSGSSKVNRLQERSLRYFPLSSGKKSCYVLELPNGRYSIRMFFIYGDYDQKARSPSFDVSVEGTVVFSWRFPWSEDEAKTGVYSDLYVFINDGDAKICFYSIATDSPVIGALEVAGIHPLSYSSNITGTGVILVNYGRFAGAQQPFGAGVTRGGDAEVRAWEPDAALATTFGESFYLTTKEAIRFSGTPPDFFPQQLYQSAHTLKSPENIEYLFTVDSSLDYMLVFHFAEIDPAVVATGQRVFDVLVNSQIVFPNVDVFTAAGSFAAYDLVHIIRNLTGSALNVTLAARVGAPMISGLENYAMVHMDLSTDPIEVVAMHALKSSLQVPERMGWNGDPCAPYNWDTWEGVTCNFAPDGKSLVITRIDLSGQGLKGSISDKASLLRHLVSLNMSHNNLRGAIPSGLGNHNLKTLDLSSNDLTGSIPKSLGQPQLIQVILNNNKLDGPVPVSLYSIGVRGGFINISSNGALCGVPALPLCPFWKQSELSTGAKVGIGVSAGVAATALGLLIYILIIRRRRDDYNFGLAHQLASRSTRYQRHKSRLRPEDNEPGIRSVSSKFGFASNMNPL